MSSISRNVAGTFAMPNNPEFRRPPLTQGIVLFPTYRYAGPAEINE
jgi:hypothetical protein